MSLIINIARLREKPEKISGELPAASLELETGGLAGAKGNLRYDLTVQLVSGELLVSGTLEIEMDLRCGRCGEGFTRKIGRPDFRRNFSLASKNELINLTADVREDILLSLPMVALCSEGCRGICGTCGVNLNRAKCACRRRDKKNAWEALDGLKLRFKR